MTRLSRAGLGLCFLSLSAQAATITVTSDADNVDSDGKVTLREAIQAAETDASVDGSEAGSGADEIVFAESLANSTIALSSSGDTEDGVAAFRIETQVTITGPSTGGITLEANWERRLFSIRSTGQLTLRRLNLTKFSANGFVGGDALFGGSGGAGAGMGGAIFNRGALKLFQCTLYGNQAIGGTDNLHSAGGGGGGGGAGLGGNAAPISQPSGGAGGANGGGAGGTYSQFAAATAGSTGGFGSGGGGGGGSFEGTPANGGPGGFGGGGGGGGGKGDGVSTTVGGAGGFGGGNGGGGSSGAGGVGGKGGTGGGGAGMGGAIFNLEGSVEIENSTLAENSAIAGGVGAQKGQGLGGGIFNYRGTLTLRQVTISGNTAEQGGAIFNYGDTGSVSLNNSILANSQGSGTVGPDDWFMQPPDSTGQMASSGVGNLIESSGGVAFSGGIVSNFDPTLGDLGDNGGPTLTLLPLMGSPAIDAGDGSAATGIMEDQRGQARVGGNTVDIGAVEAVPDTTPPTVSSIKRADANPTNRTTVHFTVKFDESVTGVDANDFALAVADGANGAVAAVSGSGSTYDVTVDSITGEGTLRLDLIDNDSIIDQATNPLGGAGSQSFTSGETYTVDVVAPDIQSIEPANAAANSSSVTFTATFSETVSGIDVADFQLSNTGTATGNIASVSGASGATVTVTVDTIEGSGTLRLDLIDNDSIVDEGNNPLGGSGAQSFTSGTVHTVDRMPPSVQQITVASTAAGADSATFTVTFSEEVSGVDAGDFTVTGTDSAQGSVGSVNATSVSSVYTVVVDALTGAGTVRLDVVDNDSIVDSASNPLGGAGGQNYSGGPTHTVDREPPEVFQINLSTSDATSATFTVGFAEAVSGVDASDFILTATGSAQGSIASVTATSLATSYVVVIHSFSGAGTLRLDIADDDSIVDAASNPLGGSGAQSFTGAEPYSIDFVAPEVSQIAVAASNGTSAVFTVTFSEDVTGVDADDFALHTTGTAQGTLGTITPTSASSYDVAVESLSGLGEVRLDLVDNDSILDLADNVLGGSGGQNYTSGPLHPVDTLPPEVSDMSVTTFDATSLTMTVAFSEAVSGVDMSDFALTTTGSAKGTINGVVAVNGTTYNVSVGSLSGSGDIRMDVIDDGSIIDGAGNPLGGGGVQSYTAGPSATLDEPSSESSGGCQQGTGEMAMVYLLPLLMAFALRRRRA